MRYKFRSVPCFPESREWCITGTITTSEGVGGGILEWCYSRQDAENIFAQMKRDPSFSNLKIERLHQ